jgi:hypothetical protein
MQEVFKPWLLQTPTERKARMEDYLGCLHTWPPIDEFILTKLKPPSSELDAIYELYIYQLRKGRK